MINFQHNNEFGMDPYVKHFENCQWRLKMCKYCLKTDILKRDLDLHIRQCEHQTKKCPNCKKEIKLKDLNTYHNCLETL